MRTHPHLSKVAHTDAPGPPHAVCAPGFYESSGKCAQCEKGSFCRGGNGNGANATVSASDLPDDAPVSEDGLTGGERSYTLSCGTAETITTAVKGSMSEAACGEWVL